MNRIAYDTIGVGYNTTRQADPYLTGRLMGLLQPEKGKTYLDIGCGTGNYTIALAGQGFRFTGIDPSDRMLKEAATRSLQVTWLKGTAEQIPAEDNAFDGAIATLTIHHWTDLQRSFAEIGRVLSPGSSIVLFTATPEQMEGYWLNHYFPSMLKASVLQMPSPERVEAAALQAGLEIAATEKYFVSDDLQDCFLYVGKHRPQLYFDEEIRKGISSFASLANKEEVAKGLWKLKEDIENGMFASVREQYSDERGDYLFVVFRKR